MSNQKSINVLLVENNPEDAYLMQEAFKATHLTNFLYVVNDGVEAMDFLHKEGEYEEAPRPDLILLALNMPRKDGREVLSEVKSDPKLQNIPVIVLTASDTETDILKSYNLHANCYITKPAELEKFIKLMKQIEHFWLNIVSLPPHGEMGYE